MLNLLLCLQYFVEVVNTGTFSAAAEVLDTSQANVSKKISALEEHLDLPLFTRSTRSLALTIKGKTIYSRALGIISELKDLESLQTDTQKPHGHIRFDCSNKFCEQFIMPLVSQYMQKNPQVTFDVRMNNLFPVLLQEDSDIIFNAHPANNQAVMSKRVYSLYRSAYANPEYLKTHEKITKPKDLLKHRALTCHQNVNEEVWTFANDEKIKVTPTLSSTAMEQLLIAASRGLGVLYCSCFYTKPYIADGSLVEVIPQYRKEEDFAYLHYLRHKITLTLQSFIDFVVKSFNA